MPDEERKWSVLEDQVELYLSCKDFTKEKKICVCVLGE